LKRLGYIPKAIGVAARRQKSSANNAAAARATGKAILAKERAVREQTDINPTELAKNHSIDFDFISTFEGGSLNKGYVPDAAYSKSGVTIAIGFDLGARNANDLLGLPLEPSLIERLRPYLGLQGMQAARYLQHHPLKISDADAKAINVAVKSKLIGSLVAKYDADSGLSFAAIPPKWQTVIASLEFQYGSLRKRCPSFWRCVTQQNWPEAIAELRDFGDRYTTRRNKEADYVEQHA
jgi:hypothetical protein